MKHIYLRLYILLLFQSTLPSPLNPPTPDPSNFFSFSFKGSGDFILDPVLAREHITGDVWVGDVNTKALIAPVKLYIKRNRLQVVAYREFTETAIIDFLAEPGKEYWVSVQAGEGVVCVVGVRRYVVSRGVQVFPRQKVGETQGRMEGIARRMGKLEASWAYFDANTQKTNNEIVAKLITEKLMSMVETIGIVIVMFLQMGYLKAQIDRSRRLI